MWQIKKPWTLEPVGYNRMDCVCFWLKGLDNVSDDDDDAGEQDKVSNLIIKFVSSITLTISHFKHVRVLLTQNLFDSSLSRLYFEKILDNGFV